MPCCLKLPVLHRYSFKSRQMHGERSPLSWFHLCLTGTRLGQMAFTLVGTLDRKLGLANNVTPVLENLCRQVHSSALASPTLCEWRWWQAGRQFPGQYLSEQVKEGSQEALEKVARTRPRHHECSRPLIHLLYIGSSLYRCMST